MHIVMEDFNKILLLTSVCCMACDGEIAKEEIESLKNLSKNQELFGKEDVNQVLSVIMDSLSKYGYNFVRSYLDLLEKADFSEQQEIQILDVATKTIYADKKVEYDEIKFFKTIRHNLKITDEKILEKVDGVEDFWLSADAQDTNVAALEINFKNADYTSLDLGQ